MPGLKKKCHYPRVKSDLRYSEQPKMSRPSSAQLTKSQVQQSERLAEKAWSKCCTKNGEEQKYKRQPKYSADESLFNRAAYKSAI